MASTHRVLALALACGAAAVGSAACSNDVEAPGAEIAPLTGSTCSSSQLARMVTQPIIPGRSIAGIDLFAGPGGTPSTIDFVGATHCMGTVRGEVEGIVTVAYGARDEVSLHYDTASRDLTGFILEKGYRGKLTFRSRPHSLADASKPNPFGEHVYTIALGEPFKRDGIDFELHWGKPCSPETTDCWEQQSAELFDAIMYTFAPGAPSTQGSCIREGTCLANVFPDGAAAFGARPLGFYFFVSSVDTAQPGPSTPEFMYGFLKPSPAAREAVEEKLAGAAK